MNITSDLKKEITDELRRVRAPAKVARNLGVDIRIVLQVVDDSGGFANVSRAEVHGGYGRQELRQFFVARKRAYQPWDNSTPEIAAAREAYEAGTHDMATGRDGAWLILYLFPRNTVTPRPGYFDPEI